ncbi:MAG: hypothetical protein N3C57_07715 [Aquificaceae bacterium]|nr:hypothetical protein [Aquificaceae bacterium]
MAQTAKIEDLPLLVRHEIGEIRRLRTELKLTEHLPAVNNLSLLLIYSGYISDAHAHNIASSMRESDILIPFGKHLVCLLPGTDKEGAIHLAEGMKDFLSEEGYYAVVTYPEDGETYEELMESLRVYLKNKGKTLPW